VIAETTKNLRQMSVEEAVMELDLTQADIVMFRHAGHGGLMWSTAAPTAI